MSGGTPPRLALLGFLAATLAAPATAQEGGFQPPLNSDPVVRPMEKPTPPEAPMPRDVARTNCTNDIATLQQWVFELAVEQMAQPVPPVPPLAMTPPALTRRSGNTVMPWSCRIASASVVVWRFAASTMVLALTPPALSARRAPPSAAGMSTSQSR